MKNLFPILLLFLLIVSCSQEVADNATGTVSFTVPSSRGVTAYIEYPSLLDKTWTLTAEKTDGKATIGQGQYEDIVLTDSLGPFSVGSWTFTITDSEGKYTGTVSTTIKAGNNNIAITLHSTASKGTLSIENCSFLKSKLGNVNYVDCYVDDQRQNNTNWVISDTLTEDGDLYVLPTLTVKLSEGTHTIRLYYASDNGGQNSDIVRVRVVNGMVTHFTLGEQEGNALVSVSFEILEPIVEE